MNINESDRLTIGRLCYTLDTPRARLMPLLSRAGVPVEMDPETGEVYTSRSAMGEFFRSAAEGGA